MREFGSQVFAVLRDGKAFWTIFFGCLFFAFAGPFGSFSDLSVAERMIFWVPVFVVAFVSVAIIHAMLMLVMPVEAVVRRRILSYLLFSSVFTPMVYGFILSGPVSWGGSDMSFAMLASWVLLTAGTCTAILAILNPDPIAADAPPSVDADPQPKIAPPRLFRRLEQCADDVAIIHLTVNDHYVLVSLSDGSEQRLLMRLSDAIAEMDDVPGFITHRSHWVSQHYVKGPYFDGRREMLELTTGVRVPVSRTYRPVLVAAGVLPEAKELTVPPSGRQLDAVQKDP